MILVRSKKRSFGINFPTSLNEVTPVVLKELTKNVELPPHYCIVALCFETKLFDFIAAMNNNKGTTTAVTPIMCKIDSVDAKDVNTKIGDKIIIDRSSLERGVHINVKTMISLTAARNYINSDESLLKAFMTNSNAVIGIGEDGKELTAKNAPNVIIMEFKIVPVNDVAATINNKAVNDPFLSKMNAIES